MAFVFNKETHSAIDKERGISICQTGDLWADAKPAVHKFRYTSPDLTFDFGAISHSENRKFFRNGAEVEWPVCIAIDILELSIQGGVGQSEHRPSYPLSSEKFDEVKEIVKEGMYALCARRDLKDDSILVPDFKVNFVQEMEFSGRAGEWAARIDSNVQNGAQI